MLLKNLIFDWKHTFYEVQLKYLEQVTWYNYSLGIHPSSQRPPEPLIAPAISSHKRSVLLILCTNGNDTEDYYIWGITFCKQEANFESEQYLRIRKGYSLLFQEGCISSMMYTPLLSKLLYFKEKGMWWVLVMFISPTKLSI